MVAALGIIFPYTLAAKSSYPYLSELIEHLFSPHDEVRKRARDIALNLKGDNPANVADQVLAILKDNSKKEQHLEAIRALAALGPAAKSAVDTLRPLVKQDHQPLAIAAAAALRRILKQPEYHKLLVEELGERFNLQLNGAVLQQRGRSEDYDAFQDALQAEEKQLFP